MPDHVWDQGLWDQARWDTRTADTGVIALTGGAVALRIVRRAPVTTAAFMLAGSAVSLRWRRAYTATAITGALTLAGQPAGLLRTGAYQLIATRGVFTLTGQAANLLYTPQSHINVVMPVTSGALLLTGTMALLRPARTPQPPIEVQPGVLNFGRHKKYLLGPWVGPWR